MLDGPNSGADKKSARSPTSVDVRIGQLIRERRNALGLRLEDLASSVGITAHQLQKYETGTNRVPASRLVECARHLQVPVARFFDAAATSSFEPTEPTGISTEEELLQYFQRLDETARAQLIRIAKILAGVPAADERT